MPSREEQAAIQVAKQTIQEIDAFVLRGTPLSPFAEAVLVNDLEEAERCAIPPVIRQGMIPSLREWVEKMLPTGVFENGREDIARWVAHGGLPGAPEGTDFWLFMHSNRWDPKRRGVVEPSA